MYAFLQKSACDKHGVSPMYLMKMLHEKGVTHFQYVDEVSSEEDFKYYSWELRQTAWALNAMYITTKFVQHALDVDSDGVVLSEVGYSKFKERFCNAHNMSPDDFTIDMFKENELLDERESKEFLVGILIDKEEHEGMYFKEGVDFVLTHTHVKFKGEPSFQPIYN